MEMRRKQFQVAGRMRINVASDVVGGKGERPQVAAYLVHVGLECWLKARIMDMLGIETLSDLKKKRPRVADRLFAGVSGHDLDELAKQAALPRLLAAKGAADVIGDVWLRMCGTERPYSLRYGAASVDRKQAEAELKVAQRVQDVLEGVLR
jgi:hypothetical protein